MQKFYETYKKRHGKCISIGNRTDFISRTINVVSLSTGTTSPGLAIRRLTVSAVVAIAAPAMVSGAFCDVGAIIQQGFEKIGRKL